MGIRKTTSTPVTPTHPQQQQQPPQRQTPGAKNNQARPLGPHPPITPQSNGRNVMLTNALRKEICQHRLLNPDMTLVALGKWAQEEFNLVRKPAIGTISRILRKHDEYSVMNKAQLAIQRRRAVLCAELDDVLVRWIHEHQRRDIHVSYKMITEKAKVFAALIKAIPGKENTEMPSFSNGWVSGFTKRHLLMGTALHGNIASEDAEKVSADQQDASGIISSSTASSSASALVNTPFPSDTELIQQSIAAVNGAREARARQMPMENQMTQDTDMTMDTNDLNDDMGDHDMIPAMEEVVEADLNHQVVHAVSRPSTVQAATFASATSKKLKSKKSESTSKDNDRSESQSSSGTQMQTHPAPVPHPQPVPHIQLHIHQQQRRPPPRPQPSPQPQHHAQHPEQTLQQVAAQHLQIHPAAPGLLSVRSQAHDRTTVGSTAGLSSALTPVQQHQLSQQHLFHHQQQHQQQHQHQHAQFAQQALMQVGTAATLVVGPSGSTEHHGSAIPAAALSGTPNVGSSGVSNVVSSSGQTTENAGSTSTSTSSARPVPTTANTLAAVRTVIESLNVNIPAEVELLRPLFDMERRLQDELHAADRQSTLLNWVK